MIDEVAKERAIIVFFFLLKSRKLLLILFLLISFGLVERFGNEITLVPVTYYDITYRGTYS